jgi:hypothetical protein
MATKEKLDLYKLHRDDYVAKKDPVLVDLDDARYLVIEGRGAPGGPEFATCIGALYGMAFTVKMTRKMAGLGDYVVCKLEAQWWHGDGKADFDAVPQEKWRWRLMIRTPDFVELAELESAAEKLIEKKKGKSVDRVALQRIGEGRCVQMLHVGPYEKEHETIAIMQAFAGELGLAFHGLHHEIYLSDPRRVAPEKLKTILRRSVK